MYAACTQVDGDPVNLSILEDLLKTSGYVVLTATSGQEALEVWGNREAEANVWGSLPRVQRASWVFLNSPTARPLWSDGGGGGEG